jgi:hypothetical protein
MFAISRLKVAALGAALLAVPALAAPSFAQGVGPVNGNGFNYAAHLAPVPTNHVTGSGNVGLELHGNRATITLSATGLVNSVHAMHIHIDGQGRCPMASDAGMHNGNTAISTVDGHPAYGMIGTSLTTSGDTSPSSALAIDRFPTGSSFTYSRTIKLTGMANDSLRDGTAVVVVHGIDYNDNGAYDFDSLGASQLDPSLPLEATAPALCGVLTAQ